MARLCLLLCATLLAALSAHAQTAAKYTIDFPAGWGAPVQDGQTIDVRAPESVGDAWCRANSNDMPSLANSTQASLNAQFATPWDAQTWGDVLTVDAGKILTFEGVSKVVDGHVVQEVTIVFADSVFGKKVTARIAAQVLVGRMVNAACFTRSETFEGLKPLFQTTINSLKPAG